MKTLCLLADARSPHLQKWVAGCRGLDARIVVISHHPAAVAGAEVIHQNLSLTAFWSSGFKVRRVIRDLRPAVVHAHQFGAHALYAWISGRRPLIITAWGSDVLVRPGQSWFLKWLLGFLVRRADLITSDSGVVTRELERYGAKPERILTFPFGIPQAVYDRLGQVAKVATRFVFCSPRLHEPLYNIDLILAAFEIINLEYPQTELWLLGDGSQTDKLKVFVKEHRIAQVKFWGRVSPAEAAERIAASRVMISIPNSDATPVSLLEAMAGGSLPLLADLPAYHDWVTDGQNGLLIKAQVDALVIAMRRSILESDLRQQAAVYNRRQIAGRAIWEREFQAMLAYYQAKLAEN